MTDERDLDDPALAAAWRAHSAETPPPALDSAILAAAHRAVKSAPAKISPGAAATRPWRWWAPLAAAATIGVIAIGALQLMPQEQDITNAVVSDMPAGAPAAPVERDAAVAKPAAPRAEETAPRFAPSPAPAPAPRRAAPSADSAATARERAAPGPLAAGKVTARAVVPEPAAAQAPAPAAPAAAPAMAKRALRDDAPAGTPRTADEWIARIRKLMADGEIADARRALTEFRAAFDEADGRLPADLRPWAATVPP